MRLHLATVVFIILEHINKIITQTMPMSPCPKMFQYRFDGAEWFGVLSIRNFDYVQALHLKITLSMRGKPTTNYLGEIELLTRGQFRSDMPVLYKVKFPKTHMPPRLLQIMANNQVICLGAADHSIFVTQIILEHTRKFTFIAANVDGGDEGGVPLPTDFLGPPSLLSDGGNIDMQNDETTKDSGTMPTAGFATKHFPFDAPFEKKPWRGQHENCGRIDERIRFRIAQAMSPRQRAAMHQTPAPPANGQNRNMNTAGARLAAAAAPPPQLPPSPAAPTPQTAAALAQMRASLHNFRAGSFVPLVTAGGGGGGGGDDDEIPITPTVHHHSGDAASMSMKMASLTAATAAATTTDRQNDMPSMTRGAWPWLAAIYVNNLTSLSYQCGGTLVSQRYVISSAHCFHMYQKRYTANEVLVFLGRHNLRNWNEEGSVTAPVDDIYIHPDYDSHLNTYDADIAVVLLKYEIRFNTFIRPACMWSGSTKLQYIEGELGIVVGWGLANLDAIAGASAHMASISAVPRIVSAPIVSNEMCFDANAHYHSLSSNRTFCAGTVTTTPRKPTTTTRQAKRPIKPTATKKSTTTTKSNIFNTELCTGDSGAGLMIYKNNRWVLRGIVSASLATANSKDTFQHATHTMAKHNCHSNQYVIYTDVAKFLDWINAFII